MQPRIANEEHPGRLAAVVLLVGCGGGVVQDRPADASFSDGPIATDASIAEADTDASSADASSSSVVVVSNDAGGGNAGSTGGRVPLQHRAAEAPCAMGRGPGMRTSGVPDPQCAADSDCVAGVNGRCEASCGPPGCFGNVCTYDACFSDEDCPARTPCDCRAVATDDTANFCETGSDCRIDSDCGPGGYCSLSNRPWCGGMAYHCHTAADQCIDDTDCVQDGGIRTSCAFDTNAGHWSCLIVCPPPP